MGRRAISEFVVLEQHSLAFQKFCDALRVNYSPWDIDDIKGHSGHRLKTYLIEDVEAYGNTDLRDLLVKNSIPYDEYWGDENTGMEFHCRVLSDQSRQYIETESRRSVLVNEPINAHAKGKLEEFVTEADKATTAIQWNEQLDIFAEAMAHS